MNLSAFKKNKKKKQTMIIFSISLVLLVAGIILYRTFALFEETDEYDVIKEQWVVGIIIIGTLM